MGYAGYLDRRGLEARSQSSISVLPYLTVSIPAWKRVADEGDDTAPEFPDCLQSLAFALHERFNHLGDPMDLDNAVEALERCVHTTHGDDDMLPNRLYKLGGILDIRFGYQDTLADLDKSILSFKRALDLLIPIQQRQFRVDALHNIGWAYKRRWAHTEDVDDIRQSVSTFQLALEEVPQGHPGRTPILVALGSALKSLGDATDDITHLTSSVSTLRQVVSIMPETDLELPSVLRNLAVSLEDRFSRNEELEDIQEAIAAAQRAVDLGTKNGTPLTSSLSILSECLKHRALFTGERLDTTSTLEVMEADIAKLNEKDPDLPGALKHLGDMTMRQFRLDGKEVHLHKAIKSYLRAIDLSPTNQQNSTLPGTYNSLSSAYLAKYDMTLDNICLDEAVDAIRTATELLPKGHGDLPPYLNCLQMTLQVQYGITNSLDDIDEAIQSGLRATQVAPPGHSALHLWWNQLGRSYKLRFEKTNDIADLDEAISIKEHALSLLPPDSITIPLRQRILGDYYVRRYKVKQDQADLRLAVSYYRASALAPAGYTDSRLHAAQSWGRYAREFDLPSSLEAYDRAISLIQLFIGLEQTQTRRHENIQEISDLSVSAAAAAFEAGEVKKALQWLEEGRCLVWGQLNSLRTPMEDLMSVDSVLAERISVVSKALEESGAGDGRTTIGVRSADVASATGRRAVGEENVNLSMEWKRLVSAVREKPGFEDFLQARPTESILKNLPSTGTIVVINVHSSRCDALALRSGWTKPMHIPLPRFSSAKARSMSKQLRGQLGLGGVRTRGYDVDDQGPEDDGGERAIRRMAKGGVQHKLIDTLRELWTSVVEPILAAIGYLVSDTTH